MTKQQRNDMLKELGTWAFRGLATFLLWSNYNLNLDMRAAQINQMNDRENFTGLKIAVAKNIETDLKDHKELADKYAALASDVAAIKAVLPSKQNR